MYRNKQKEELVLASASPRRKDLLSSVGIAFEVCPADIDEAQEVGEVAEQLVARLSLNKANKVATELHEKWILAADTVVELDGEILGKPRDNQDAKAMLTALSGSSHSVWGGLSLVNYDRKVAVTKVSETDVRMRSYSSSEIESYVSSGEPLGKAGSYAIQGKGSAFVEAVNGSYSNVVGLNLALTIDLLIQFGVLSDG